MQSTIYSKLALGKPGTIARLEPTEKIPVIAEGDAVYAGGFVFEGTDPERQVIGPSAETASKTSVAGVAVFEQFQPAFAGLTGLNSLKLNEGENLALVRKGYVYVTPSTASTHGQNVIVNVTTGAIKTATVTYTTSADLETGAVTTTSDIESGFIDTGWVVETGNASGQVCEIRK